MEKKLFDKLFFTVGWGLYGLVEKTKSVHLRVEFKKLAEVQFLTLEKICSRKKCIRDVYHALGVLYCYWRPPRFRESKKYLEKTLELSKTKQRKAQVINAFGNLYYEMGRHRRALTFYQKALMSTNYRSLPLYNIAFTYEKMGDKQEAIKFALASIEEMKKETDLKHTTNPKKTLEQLIKRCRRRG